MVRRHGNEWRMQATGWQVVDPRGSSDGSVHRLGDTRMTRAQRIFWASFFVGMGIGGVIYLWIS